VADDRTVNRIVYAFEGSSTMCRNGERHALDAGAVARKPEPFGLSTTVPVVAAPPSVPVSLWAISPYGSVKRFVRSSLRMFVIVTDGFALRVMVTGADHTDHKPAPSMARTRQ